jgi:hypothetical protein
MHYNRLHSCATTETTTTAAAAAAAAPAGPWNKGWSKDPSDDSNRRGLMRELPHTSHNHRELSARRRLYPGAPTRSTVCLPISGGHGKVSKVRRGRTCGRIDDNDGSNPHRCAVCFEMMRLTISKLGAGCKVVPSYPVFHHVLEPCALLQADHVLTGIIRTVLVLALSRGRRRTLVPSTPWLVCSGCNIDLVSASLRFVTDSLDRGFTLKVHPPSLLGAQ